MSRKVVDLPEPLGPIREKNSPGLMEKEHSSTAAVAPWYLTRSRTSTLYVPNEDGYWCESGFRMRSFADA